MPTKKTAIGDFLSATAGLKEASLAIAKNSNELSKLAKTLKDANFKKLDSVFDFQNAAHGWYVIIDDQEKFKEIYDFICQYPITVISLFDSKNSKTIIIKPDYKNPTVFIITEEHLKAVQQAGFDLLGRVGAAYRS